MYYTVHMTTLRLMGVSFFACLTLSNPLLAQETDGPSLASEVDLLDDPETTINANGDSKSQGSEPIARVACALFNVKNVDETARDAEFARLAQQVSILEQQAAVLRSVVKLVGPSVVHIEAEKEEPEFDRDAAQHESTAPDSGMPADAEAPVIESESEYEPSYEVDGYYETPYEGSYESYPSDAYEGYSVIPNAYIEEAGSGVLIRIDDNVYVLTNRHVVTGCELNGIRIKLHDGRMIYPNKKWEDPNTDVAVLSVSADRLVPARLGNSEKVEIGDFVLAFGSPFGLSRSVTYGIISAKGRRDLILGSDPVGIQNFLQTDAAINPGNSGGPLLNTHGEVIGLNTAIASNSGGNDGIGFSIPINIAMHVATQLVNNGELIRAYLGVRLDSAFRAKAAHDLGLPRLVGARVTGVTEGSPAEKGEMAMDDVIVSFNGVQVEDDNHLVSLVGLTPPNAEVKMVVVRDGEPVRLCVTLSQRMGQSDHY